MSDATAKSARASGSSSLPPVGLPVEEFLCFTVYSTVHAFNRVYKPLLDELGLTYPQYLVMVSLWAKDDQTVGELGEALVLESSTLTPLLKRLEAAGNLTRTRDACDGRQVRGRLTTARRALQKKTPAFPRGVNHAKRPSFGGPAKIQRVNS